MSAWTKLWIISFIFLAGKASSSNISSVLNQSCRTNTNVPGQCVPIEQCKTLHEETSALIEDYKSTCGLQGNISAVCCPQTKEEHPNIGLVRKYPCGKYPSQDRVYYFVYPGDYASTALLMLEEGSQRIFCGGNLINDRYVLTAASCVDDLPKGERMLVRLGENILSTNIDCSVDYRDSKLLCGDPVQEYGVEEVTRYEALGDVEGRVADLALIRLNETVNITDYVSPICLPAEDELHDDVVGGEPMLLAGWAITKNGTKNDQMGVILMKATNCSDHELPSPTERTTFCIEGREREGFCVSDRGGGIMNLKFYEPKSVIRHLVGVAAAGKDCDGSNPRVYTRVGPYVNWILSKMRP